MGNSTPRGGRKAVDDQEIKRLNLENAQLLKELIEARMLILELQQAPTLPTGTTNAEEDTRDSLHPKIEAEIAYSWGDVPQAAAISRQVALAMFRDGMDPQKLANMIRNSGVKVD